jgi:cell wall-associated NlpC family hydrolase
MKRTHKKLLISISLLSTILLSTGCAPKNADGSYASAYSYHPYLNNGQQQERSTNDYSYRASSNYIANNIENTAKSLLGTDYKYGANGPYQYDCSSFTKHVFSKQGINIPRVSRDQAQRGQYIQARQLQKGDLVFFDSKKSARISHVGIYLGRGDFIHASSSQDKVAISNLSSNYYSKHFKWGRRVINVNYAMK